MGVAVCVGVSVGLAVGVKVVVGVGVGVAVGTGVEVSVGVADAVSVGVAVGNAAAGVALGAGLHAANNKMLKHTMALLVESRSFIVPPSFASGRKPACWMVMARTETHIVGHCLLSSSLMNLG